LRFGFEADVERRTKARELRRRGEGGTIKEEADEIAEQPWRLAALLLVTSERLAMDRHRKGAGTAYQIRSRDWKYDEKKMRR
jgi:hypothetical protein